MPSEYKVLFSPCHTFFIPSDMFLSKPEKQPCIFCKLNDTSACQQRLVIQCLLILLVKLVNLNLMGEKFKIPKIVKNK